MSIACLWKMASKYSFLKSLMISRWFLLNKLNLVLVGQVQCLNACRPQWDAQSMPFCAQWEASRHQGAINPHFGHHDQLGTCLFIPRHPNTSWGSVIETPKARLLGVPSNPLARYLEGFGYRGYIYIYNFYKGWRNQCDSFVLGWT